MASFKGCAMKQEADFSFYSLRQSNLSYFVSMKWKRGFMVKCTYHVQERRPSGGLLLSWMPGLIVASTLSPSLDSVRAEIRKGK